MLEKLDNNEFVLLMYLAEELPPVDRAEIERMLAGDESLRKQLAVLQLAQETTANALQALDAMSPVGGFAGVAPGSAAEAAAIRRIGRSMRSHLARQLAERPVAPVKRGLLFPWWAYPTAATAASVLAFLVWFANYTGNSQLNIPGDTHPQQAGIFQPDDPQIKTVTTLWGQNEDPRQEQIDEHGREMAQELATITAASDDESAVWKVGNGDGHE